MALEAATAALIALTAFDAGVYLHASRGAKGHLEAVAEPVMFAATVAALAIGLMVGGRPGALIVLATLFARAGFDGLHLGDGNVLAIELARDYPLYALLTKAAAGALYILFAFPA